MYIFDSLTCVNIYVNYFHTSSDALRLSIFDFACKTITSTAGRLRV